MVSLLKQALSEDRDNITAVLDIASSKRAPDLGGIFGETGNSMFSMFDQASDQQRHKEQYALFRGWVYAAIHAIASEGSLQAMNVAQRTSDQKAAIVMNKSARVTVPNAFKQMAKKRHLALMPDHPLHACMVCPNPLQDEIGFVYSFIANLCLTGWGYIIGGPTGEKDRPYEFYSVPTTWVTPLHKDGPFSEFRVGDPNQPVSTHETFPRELVAFAHLPNPADMKSALAPAGAQIQAIRIDDHIQTSQERFFENGVFPSVIVEMGKDPHPDVPAGIRPRLTPAQRRQVMGAIRKVMGGVANYGSSRS